jgi:ATPase subunit of ABC transporter with duplicated ATPase domains
MSIDTYHWVGGETTKLQTKKKIKRRKQSKANKNTRKKETLEDASRAAHREPEETRRAEQRREQRDKHTERQRQRECRENIVCIPVRPCKMACLGPLPVTVTHKSTHVSLAEKSRCGCCFC